MDYDPNLVFSGCTAVQTVRLTFGQWEYRKTMEVAVGGNCRGFSVIEAAVENAYEKLPDASHASGVKTITLIDESGGEMECDEDEEDWLNNMLIAAEIIDIKPEGE